MRYALSTFLALLTACCAPAYNDLKHARQVHPIDIYAATGALADTVSSAIEVTLPYVRSIPGHRSHEKSGLVYVFEETGGSAHGTAYENWVELYVGHDAAPDSVRYLVAHEMTHYFLGGDWHLLPAVLEEGVCELIAQRVAPDVAAQRRTEHAVHLGTAIRHALNVTLPLRAGNEVRHAAWTLRADIDREALPVPDKALDLTREEFTQLEPEINRQMLTAFGYLLASRIGMDGLVGLCAEARERGWTIVPSGRIYEVARLERGNPAAWMPAIQELIGTAEIAHITQTVTGQRNKSGITVEKR